MEEGLAIGEAHGLVPMEDQVDTAVLGLSEAVPLVHAWISSLCDAEGIRVLFLKGPGAGYLGLRSPRESSDVDVLVSRSDSAVLRGALKEQCWQERPRDWTDDVFPEHSFTLYHHAWPCDIDIHYLFPGFEADNTLVFDTLWTERSTMMLAGREITIPGRVGGTLVLALHALRSPEVSRHKEDLAFLAASHCRAEMSEAIAMARTTCALGPLRPFIEMAYQDAEVTFPPPSRDWLMRSTAHTSAAIRLVQLVDAPWRRKLGMLFRALLPSRTALAAVDLTVSAKDRRQIWQLRFGRVSRFAVELPKTMSGYRAFRRAERTATESRKGLADL